ncbi:MAG TPA: MG2 domain-containing protein [Acidobacteriaceae bacterium]|jgi:hypothetical protein
MLLAAFLVLTCCAQARAEASPYFTLSTEKTFAPGDKPKLHLYTRNVPDLEFRVYRVQDQEKFLDNLADLHSFGEPTNIHGPTEDIDEKTWLERFHDWKADILYDIKTFFRRQLSVDTRDSLKARQATLAQRSRIVGVAQFAQIPLLNDKQLVARWHQQVPPTYVSDNQILPIDPLPSGMYLVEATDGHLKAYTVLMVSKTALITRTVAGQVLAFVVDRKTGSPVAGAKVTLSRAKQPLVHAITGADGTAIFPVAPAAKPANADADPNADENGGGESSGRLWVLARSGDDPAVVTPWSSYILNNDTSTYTGYTYTDRPVYRPGHTVHFRSILRDHNGDALILPKVKEVQVTVTDEANKTVYDKRLSISAMGTVQGSLDLPADAALGSYSINITVGDGDAHINEYSSFRVEEYRKPEYQVRVSAAKQRVLQGQSNQATIEARYFFGEPVASAKVKYNIYQSPHYWWGDPSDDDSNSPGMSAGGEDGETDTGYAGDQNSQSEGHLDADGKLVVTVPTSFNEKQHLDQDYVVEGSVTDEAGREITGRYRFLATYGSFHIHVEPVSYSIETGQQAGFMVSATDYDGKPVQTAIHLHLVQRKYRAGGSEDETNAGDADVTTGADGRGSVQLPISLAGSIYVTASAQTPERRQVQDTTYLWVTGKDQGDFYGSENGQAQIIADKKSYAPGDTAHLTLISQVAGFHALVTATGYTAEFRKVLSTDGKTLSFDLPITHDSQPNLTVDAVFLKDETVYQANKSIKVPPTQQQLQVTISPAATTFQPGQAAQYDVNLRDASGAPVAAELSFGVVDEAIYSLYPDASGDIVKALYPMRYPSSDIENSLSYYFMGEAGLRNPLLAERHSRYRPQLAQVKPGNDTVQPKIRKAFPDTAFWQPDVRTDANGHARVSLNFPDSLTTWRATVRAITADSKAGSAVNRVIVRKNIIVRMGQPRFMRKGDLITVPVIVHNYLTEPKQVQISLEAQGVEITGGSPQAVTIAPRAEATVNYHLRATAIGTATLTAKALSTQESDALQITLPVHPSGVAETLASSGSIANSGEANSGANFPAGTDPAAHSLKVEVSPSLAGSVFSALDYLTGFPYGCTEQTMSGFLPDVIVAQAMQQLHATPHTKPATLNAEIEAGITRLRDYHHSDGGWGWWKEDDSQVFMTAYVVSGLAQANKAGYTHAHEVAEDGIGYLSKALIDHPRMKPELRAYVVYALAEANGVGKDQLDTLYSRRNDLSPQALAYTGLAMLDSNDSRAQEIARLLESKARSQGEFASWQESRNELLDIDYDASVETTAFVLKFLAHADPNNPLLAKSAVWLAANRSEGYYWSSTQQTAFAIYGLTDYLAISHELSPDIDAEIFVNGTSVGKRHFTQSDALNGTTLAIQVDASKLQPQGNNIRVVTKGTGRAYWSVAGNYFSTAKNSYQQGSMNLNIARDYSMLVPTQKDGKIVYRLQPLSGPVQQGDVLAVHIGVTGSPQKYIMIEDPIPSGTEFVSQNLIDGYNILNRPTDWSWWYTREEFHDDRATIFSDYFEGRHDSFYLVKVVNPGSFSISPARVAPMYQPGVQATTDELHLDVKEVQP